MIKLSKLINEIGEGSAKPFSWKPKGNIKTWIQDTIDTVNKATGKSTMTRIVPVDDFQYSFTSDKTGTQYNVTISSHGGKNHTLLKFGSMTQDTFEKLKESRTKYFIESSLSFGLEKDVEGIDPETNLNEQFRVMATVIDCVRHFLTYVESSTDLSIRELNVYPKSDTPDEEGNAQLSSRRGKLYVAYAKKLINQIPSKRKFYAQALPDDVGFRIYSAVNPPRDSFAGGDQ